MCPYNSCDLLSSGQNHSQLHPSERNFTKRIMSNVYQVAVWVFRLPGNEDGYWTHLSGCRLCSHSHGFRIRCLQTGVTYMRAHQTTGFKVWVSDARDRVALTAVRKAILPMRPLLCLAAGWSHGHGHTVTTRRDPQSRTGRGEIVSWICSSEKVP